MGLKTPCSEFNKENMEFKLDLSDQKEENLSIIVFPLLKFS